MQSTKSLDLVSYYKFLPWQQLNGCSVPRPSSLCEGCGLQDYICKQKWRPRNQLAVAWDFGARGWIPVLELDLLYHLQIQISHDYILVSVAWLYESRLFLHLIFERSQVARPCMRVSIFLPFLPKVSCHVTIHDGLHQNDTLETHVWNTAIVK